jgi:hypothetical protein
VWTCLIQLGCIIGVSQLLLLVCVCVCMCQQRGVDTLHFVEC